MIHSTHSGDEVTDKFASRGHMEFDSQIEALEVTSRFNAFEAYSDLINRDAEFVTTFTGVVEWCGPGWQHDNYVSVYERAFAKADDVYISEADDFAIEAARFFSLFYGYLATEFRSYTLYEDGVEVWDFYWGQRLQVQPGRKLVVVERNAIPLYQSKPLALMIATTLPPNWLAIFWPSLTSCIDPKSDVYNPLRFRVR